jgi:hypothetical protein
MTGFGTEGCAHTSWQVHTMRFAVISFLVAMILFVGGATSLVGSWAVSAACLLFLTAAIAGAVTMEERDLGAVEGLVPAQSSDGRTGETDAPLLDAA